MITRKSVKSLLFFPTMFIWMELMFHLSQFGSLSISLLYCSLFAVSYGALAYSLSSVFSHRVNFLLAWMLSLFSILPFGLQTVYYRVFKVYISVYSIAQNAGDATEFWKEALDGIIACLPSLVLYVVIPLVMVGIAINKNLLTEQVPLKLFLYAESNDDTAKAAASETEETSVGATGEPTANVPAPKHRFFVPSRSVMGFVIAVLFYILGVFSLRISGREAFTPYELYHGEFILDMSIEKLGVLTSTGLDFKAVLFGADDIDVDLDVPSGSNGIYADKLPEIAVNPSPAAEPSPIPTPAGEPAPDSAEPVETEAPTPTPTPIDTSPNVLEIDFAALAENESDEAIRTLHEYFASAEPTRKNEYTGMFEGYNFIYLTCEGFSPWAVDKEKTPTLYKLTHEGFVFSNFYNPIWGTSTSDGEYVECIGLLPYSTNSFKRSKNNALPFCMGWQFLKLGYTSRAYHAHTATYYGREYTHPNMGYEFKAKKAGLQITDVWPESDLEMIQNSLPDYIYDDHFHVYYMTVSGHLEYSFGGNTQAAQHKDDVADLPYSNACKAYIACNMELDLALEYLINALEEAGKLDNTVIAFGADHYPYGLTNDEINELAGVKVDTTFELYRNNFVIWNSQITEPIIIDKYCSSIDMMPTLSNLFGLEYDSRLFMGTDLLSDSSPLVIFNDKSWITEYCKYSSSTGKVTMLMDVELPEGYISAVNKIVSNKFAVSKSILLNDYYRYIMDYIPNVVTERPVYEIE